MVNRAQLRFSGFPGRQRKGQVAGLNKAAPIPPATNQLPPALPSQVLRLPFPAILSRSSLEVL